MPPARSPRPCNTWSLWSLAVLVGCAEPRKPAFHVDAPADPYHRPPTDTLRPVVYEGWKQFRLLCDRCHGEDARGTSFGPDLLPALRPDGATPTLEAFTALMTLGRPGRGMPSALTLGLQPSQFPGLFLYLQGRASGEFLGGRPARRGR